jgi:hypothetical protein
MLIAQEGRGRDSDAMLRPIAHQLRRRTGDMGDADVLAGSNDRLSTPLCRARSTAASCWQPPRPAVRCELFKEVEGAGKTRRCRRMRPSWLRPNDCRCGKASKKELAFLDIFDI